MLLLWQTKDPGFYPVVLEQAALTLTDPYLTLPDPYLTLPDPYLLFIQLELHSLKIMWDNSDP